MRDLKNCLAIGLTSAILMLNGCAQQKYFIAPPLDTIPIPRIEKYEDNSEEEKYKKARIIITSYDGL